MTAKPDITPIWGSDGAALLIEPSDAKKALGWEVEKPPVEYMNWLQNQLSKFINHVNERGIAAHDLATTYILGALALGSDGITYKSQQAANTNHEPTTDDFTWWRPFGEAMGEFPLPEAVQWDRLENRLPAPTNDYIGLLVDDNEINKYTASGVLDWAVVPSDVDASAIEFVVPPIFNTAADTMFVIARESTTIFHVGSINYSTGVVTDLGNFTVALAYTISNFPGVFMRHGGANEFEFYYNNQPQQKVVINATTAAIISEGDFSQKAGTEVFFGGQPYGASYITADDSIAVTAMYNSASFSEQTIIMWRNGAKKEIRVAAKYSAVSRIVGSSTWPLVMFDDYVVLAANEGESTISIGGSSATTGIFGVYNRTDFDLWLKDIADYYGLPEA